MHDYIEELDGNLAEIKSWAVRALADLEADNARLIAELTALRRIVHDAPHADFCWGDRHGHTCVCWKVKINP